MELTNHEKQTFLPEYLEQRVKHFYIPLQRNYKSNTGLSERQLKKRLLRHGWQVWRGGSINILSKPDLYPNVKKKYEHLTRLLEEIHPKQLDFLRYLCSQAGMPDFICFRNGKFKFVECKFKNESLSERQKKCFQKLQRSGFKVEVHKLVDFPTKIREAVINIHTGQKLVTSRQLALRA